MATIVTDITKSRSEVFRRKNDLFSKNYHIQYVWGEKRWYTRFSERKFAIGRFAIYEAKMA